MLIEKFNELTCQLLIELMDYYGDRLESAVLFGSVARKTPGYESDIDLLIIAENLPDGRMSRVREFDAIEKRMDPMMRSMKQYNIHTRLSPVFKTKKEALNGSPLFIDMVEDAVILFDRNSFFKEIIEGMRLRLEKRGARRVWKGNAWYWDLKPDYRPGEVFDI